MGAGAEARTPPGRRPHLELLRRARDRLVRRHDGTGVFGDRGLGRRGPGDRRGGHGPADAKGEAVLRGERLSDWDLATAHAAVCPACLRDDLDNGPGLPAYRPHWRAWWRIRFLRVCPRHRIRLIASGPDGKPLNAAAADPREAAGPKIDLAEAETQAVEDVRGEAYVLGRLGYGPRTLMPILDDLPLRAAIRTLDRFGAVAAGGRRAYTSFDGEVDPHDALTAGAAIFADGKTGLDRFLDGLVASSDPRGGKWGPRQVYGQVYMWLDQERRSPHDAYGPIRDLVAGHALRSFPLNPNEELFGQKIGERRLFTLHHVWKETGSTPRCSGPCSSISG